MTEKAYSNDATWNWKTMCQFHANDHSLKRVNLFKNWMMKFDQQVSKLPPSTFVTAAGNSNRNNFGYKFYSLSSRPALAEWRWAHDHPLYVRMHCILHDDCGQVFGGYITYALEIVGIVDENLMRPPFVRCTVVVCARLMPIVHTSW